MKTFPANMNSLYGILSFVRKEIEQMNFIAFDTRKIEIAVEEIVVNIISYAYKETSSKNPIIRIGLTSLPKNKGIAIDIQDNGTPYNPLECTYASRSTISSVEEPIGGFGIFLVLHLMDKVDYKYEADRNVLTLIKYIENGDANSN